MFKELPLDEIRPAKDPIRQTRDEEKIRSLAQSISEKGVLQPIKVRPVSFDGTTKYEIVFGARRWEASSLTGLETIPVIIERMEDDEAIAQGLLENIQKDDMSDKDIAEAVDRYLHNKCDLSSKNYVKSDEVKAEKELAKLLGIGREQLRRYRTMLKPSRKPIVETFYEENPNVRDVKTKADWLQQAMPNEDIEIQKAVARKAVKEELGQNKVRQVARSVANAPTSEAKRKLIDWEFNTEIHNPERIKERAERLGPYDDLYLNKEPSQQDEWEKVPEIKIMVDGLIETIKAFTQLLKTINKASKIEGRLSFEAKQFTVTKLKKFRDEINTLLNELEMN